jgi:hypothetical protein
MLLAVLRRAGFAGNFNKNTCIAKWLFHTLRSCLSSNIKKTLETGVKSIVAATWCSGLMPWTDTSSNW